MAAHQDSAEVKRPVETSAKSNAWRVAASTGWDAAKRNRIPALVMWIFGICLITGYFYMPFMHEALESIGRFKQSWGLRFSIVSTAVFGGLIPSVIPRLLGQTGRNATLGFVVASTILWAYKGLEIDLFYQFQAWLFGNEADFQTIATKTFCDQLIMVPIIGMPNVVLFYRWRDCRYSFHQLRKSMGNDWYQRWVLPPLIANWFVWIPAVAMIYSLPIALQLPIQNLILCFWVLILVCFTDANLSESESHSEAESEQSIPISDNK